MLPGLTAEEARDLMLSVGTHHGKRRLSPVEVAELFGKALAAGCTPENCAQFAGFKGSTMILHFQRLLRVDPSLRHLIDWKQSESVVPFIVASELGRLNQDEQEEAFRVVIEQQMRRLEVIQMIQLRNRTRRRVRECALDVVGMRPNVARKHVFLGAVERPEVRTWLAGLHQCDRDVVLAKALLTIYGQLPHTSGRLGPDRFTIVTDEAGASRIKSDVDSTFEVAINHVLAKKVLQV